jgi:hypothetical protein
MIEKDSWVYRSGDIWLPRRYVALLGTYLIGDDTTLFYITYWHGMHLLSGVLFGLLLLFYKVPSPVLTYLVLHTLWELWQLWIGMTKPTVRGLLDIGVDTLAGLLGLALIRVYA